MVGEPGTGTRDFGFPKRPGVFIENMFSRNLLVFSLLIFLIGCQRTPTFQFGAYSEAEQFYEKGKYEKAIAKYQEYLKENREGNMAVIAYYYMAKSYQNLGLTREARQLYKRIVKEYPDLIWADFSKTQLKELK